MSAGPDELREALAPRAFLHEDPASYLAGVEDALSQAVVDEGADAETA